MPNHRVGIQRSAWERLQHVTVFYDLSLFVETKYIDGSMFFPRLVQIAHMNEREVSIDCHALDLAGNATSLLRTAPAAHVLPVSLTLHERHFTRKRSGLTIAAETLANNAGWQWVTYRLS